MPRGERREAAWGTDVTDAAGHRWSAGAPPFVPPAGRDHPAEWRRGGGAFAGVTGYVRRNGPKPPFYAAETGLSGKGDAVRGERLRRSR